MEGGLQGKCYCLGVYCDVWTRHTLQDDDVTELDFIRIRLIHKSNIPRELLEYLSKGTKPRSPNSGTRKQQICGTLFITCAAVWCVVMCASWWHLLQTTLERHVNGHFNQSEAGNGNAGPRRSLESTSSKLFRRNGKKLRYRRQPWSGRAVCAGLHSQLLPNHMYDIISELHLNAAVDGVFVRHTVVFMMCVQFGFGN